MDKNNDITQEAIDTRIESFLRGEMTSEEEAAFKQEIQADPELRAHVRSTARLRAGERSSMYLRFNNLRFTILSKK